MSRRLYQFQIPLFICSVIIAFMLASYYINSPQLDSVGNELVSWATTLSAWTLLFGYFVLMFSSIKTIATRGQQTASDWYRRLIIFVSFVVFLVLGITLPGGWTGTDFYLVYQYLIVYSGAGATVAWLGLTYAAYTVIRPRSIETVVFLFAWTFRLLRDLPIWTMYLPQIQDVANWIMDVPSVGAQRGTLIATGIASIILGLRALIMREPGLIELEVD
jgi:hypothetical protein